MNGIPFRRLGRPVAAAVVTACALAVAGCVAAPSPYSQHSNVAARTTSVPAPSGGTTAQVIDPGQPGPVTKVDFADPAKLKGGVTVRLAKITALEVKAKTPGEVTGPAVAVQVQIQNDSDHAINVDSAIVSLIDPDGTLGQPTTSEPYRALVGDIAPGKAGEGVYVFLIPKNDRKSLTLAVEYLAGAPTAHFVGTVS